MKILLKIICIYQNKKKNFKLDLRYQNELTPPVCEAIYILWSAPITKFWINLVSVISLVSKLVERKFYSFNKIFYIIYLSIFGLAVLWPGCGNIFVDTVVWFWTALICCETTRRKLFYFFSKYSGHLTWYFCFNQNIHSQIIPIKTLLSTGGNTMKARRHMSPQILDLC